MRKTPARFLLPRYEFTRTLSRSRNFIRLIEFDFAKLNLNLVEKIELDCHVSVVGASRPPTIPRRLAVQVLLAT